MLRLAGTRRRRRDHQLAVGRRREDGRAARRRRQGDRRPHLRASRSTTRASRARSASARSRRISRCPCTPRSTSGSAAATSSRTCGGSGRRATARPRRTRSPTTSSTSCSCGASPRQCREHIQRYIDNGVTTPAPALFCGPDQLRAACSTPSSRRLFDARRASQGRSVVSGLELDVVVADVREAQERRACARGTSPGSISPRCSAKRAEVGAAWWLLCRPSPPVIERERLTVRRRVPVRLLAEPVPDRVDRAREHDVGDRVHAGGEEADPQREPESAITITRMRDADPEPDERVVERDLVDAVVPGCRGRTCGCSPRRSRPACRARRCRAAPARTRRPPGCADPRRCRSRRGACGAPRPTRAAASRS